MSTSNETDELFQPFDAKTEIENGVNTQDLDEFDPFHIGTSSPESPKTSPSKSRQRTAASLAGSLPSKGSVALPPRLEVKFKIHEEISSSSDSRVGHEGSSKVFVEGVVKAQVSSSDAIKNAPFVLVIGSSSGSNVSFKATDEYAKTYPSTTPSAQMGLVKIPKSVVDFVDTGSYQLVEPISHLPMLLERKVTREKAKVQVAVQVRSKLSNPDDMKQMSIVLSVSDKIDGDTVDINVGDGEWDRASRTILWKVERLAKGESFMVSVRAKLTDENKDVETSDLIFPVMMRCESEDQISSATFQAIEASGYPSTISMASVRKSFRIVHRLK